MILGRQQGVREEGHELQEAGRRRRTVLRTNASFLTRDLGQTKPLWLVFSWVKWG